MQRRDFVTAGGATLVLGRTGGLQQILAGAQFAADRPGALAAARSLVRRLHRTGAWVPTAMRPSLTPDTRPPSRSPLWAARRQRPDRRRRPLRRPRQRNRYREYRWWRPAYRPDSRRDWIADDAADRAEAALEQMEKGARGDRLFSDDQWRRRCIGGFGRVRNWRRRRRRWSGGRWRIAEVVDPEAAVRPQQDQPAVAELEVDVAGGAGGHDLAAENLATLDQSTHQASVAVAVPRPVTIVAVPATGGLTAGVGAGGGVGPAPERRRRRPAPEARRAHGPAAGAAAGDVQPGSCACPQLPQVSESLAVSRMSIKPIFASLTPSAYGSPGWSLRCRRAPVRTHRRTVADRRQLPAEWPPAGW